MYLSHHFTEQANIQTEKKKEKIITEREEKLSAFMVFFQVLISVIIFVSTNYFFDNTLLPAIKVMFCLQIAVVWGFLMSKLHLGVIFRASSLPSLLRGYLVTICFGSVLMLTESFFLKHLERLTFLSGYVATFAICNLLGLILFKIIFYNTMIYLRRNGFNSRNVMLICDNSNQDFINSFIQADDWGYRIHAIVSPTSELRSNNPDVKVFHRHEQLSAYIQENPIEDIFFCMNVSNSYYNIDSLVREADELGVTIHVLQNSNIKNPSLINKKNSFLAHNFVTYQKTCCDYTALKIKELFDIFFSVFALIGLSPLMTAIAILIKLEDRGPVFFKQERIGQNGRRFVCFKFRTMVTDAEARLKELEKKNEADGPVFKIKDDPRITRIGHFLRKTSLDEIPQFYNVLKGEMSVVGPRPPLLKEVQVYERAFLRRLSVKPGITCIWQVWGRHKVDFKQWIKMDLSYIDNWSLLLDIKIIFSTISIIFKPNGQ